MTQEGESQEETLEQTRSLVHPKSTTKIGNWNVRTLYQSGNVAQVAREMTRRDKDIMGISETHWTGRGKIKIAERETIIYPGRDDNIHREGVAILLSKKASSALIDWTPVNERIIIARFFSKHIKLTVVHIYAPTEDQVKYELYARLQEVLERRNRHDMLIITSDMNAKVGSDNGHYERIMGRHGLGVRNDNGERLCEMCDLNELVVTGTLFPHKNIHKETPNGTIRNQIDHVLVNRRFRNSVKDTRVFRSADIGSDHLLVCTTVKLRLRKQCKEKRCERVKYDIEKLKDADTVRRFNIAVRNRFQVLDNEEFDREEDEVERKFRVIQKTYTETAKEILGRPRKKKKPWISEASWKLVEERGEINKKNVCTNSERVKGQLKEEYKVKDREVKRSLKAHKKKWIDNIASDAEEAARSQHMKTSYSLTKTLCNERPRSSTAVLDKNGNLISGKAEVFIKMDRTLPGNPGTTGFHYRR
ncbi:craniofacial development protein 2-like [Ylistrum balloti]|uniref:craniofacial development protein 2-like n=1 Tax=Ylistrum balloti TaxID=509963 RepID=UPI002905A798|nr:craniofacial development protein 2-like [Ylistrum balloti]